MRHHPSTFSSGVVSADPLKPSGNAAGGGYTQTLPRLPVPSSTTRAIMQGNNAAAMDYSWATQGHLQSHLQLPSASSTPDVSRLPAPSMRASVSVCESLSSFKVRACGVFTQLVVRTLFCSFCVSQASSRLAIPGRFCRNSLLGPIALPPQFVSAWPAKTQLALAGLLWLNCFLPPQKGIWQHGCNLHRFLSLHKRPLNLNPLGSGCRTVLLCPFRPLSGVLWLGSELPTLCGRFSLFIQHCNYINFCYPVAKLAVFL